MSKWDAGAWLRNYLATKGDISPRKIAEEAYRAGLERGTEIADKEAVSRKWHHLYKSGCQTVAQAIRKEADDH